MKYYRFSLFPIANQPRQVEFYKWLLTEQILIGFIDTIPMTKLSNVGNYNSSFRFFFPLLKLLDPRPDVIIKDVILVGASTSIV